MEEVHIEIDCSRVKPITERARGSVLSGEERRAIAALAGTMLKRLREQTGISQTAAAEAFSFTQPALSYLEAGQNVNMSVEKLVMLSIFYGHDPLEVMAQILDEYHRIAINCKQQEVHGEDRNHNVPEHWNELLVAATTY